MKKYKISTQNGKTLIIKAKNKLIAQKLAHNKGVKITNIQELYTQGFSFTKKLKSTDLALFFKELALLLESGISLQQALNELYENSDEKQMKIFLNRLTQSLKSGLNLSTTFENSGFYFDKSELTLIKMGENTGDLGFVFSKLCHLREKSLDNAKRLKKALSYPIFVFLTLIIAFCALMFFVVPQFKSIFDEFDIALPLITRLMLNSYDFLHTFYPLILFITAFFLMILFLLYKSSTAFVHLIHSLVLKLPVFSKLIFYHQNVRFFLVFSMLLKSGVSAIKALELAKSSFENNYLERKCQKIIEFCEQGLSLDEAFRKVNLFENIVLGMLCVAMKSAKLDFMSEKISHYYEGKAGDLMESFLRFLEPLMTLVVAILVLFLALGIFLPMWELNKSINF